jgi:hypothetical protein
MTKPHRRRAAETTWWIIMTVVVVLAATLLSATTSQAFSVSLPTTRSPSRFSHYSSTLAATRAPLASNTRTTKPTSSTAVSQDAQDLLELLLHRYQNPNDSSSTPMNKIAELIQRLAQAQVVFDPAECLNGPLYVVLHKQGPKVPLWEKIGVLSQSSNIQGQQYTVLPKGGSGDENDNDNDAAEADFTVVNYAEILGKGMSTRKIHQPNHLE